MASGNEEPQEIDDVLLDAESGFRPSRVRAVMRGLENVVSFAGYAVVLLIAANLAFQSVQVPDTPVAGVLAVLMAAYLWLACGKADKWYLLALPPRDSPVVLRCDDVEAVVCSSGVTLTTGWKIQEQDEDWEWEQRDQWNATVDGAESALMAALWLSPALRTTARFRQLVHTVDDALQNNF